MRILSIIFLTLFFVACDSNKNETAAKGESENNDKTEIVVKVGSEGAYKPFSYVDADGVVQGYDIEVLRMIENIDPTIKFDFKYAPWNALFLGLDSDRFDLLANQIVKTPEREERYLFNEIPYFVSTSQFIAREDDATINTTSDLKGKIAGCVVGSSHTKVLEDWNNKNGNILEIRYYKDLAPLLQDLVNKRIDIHLNDPASITDIVKEQGLKLKILDERIDQKDVYFILRNEDKSKEIIQKIDAALRIAKESNELSDLSFKFFGVDQSK